MNLLGVLEGILFVVGDEGVTLKQICNIMNIEIDEAKSLLQELKKSYESDSRGIRISYLGDAFKLTTKKEHKEYYKSLVENPENNTLSQAALETLAIVAYNQPITRMELDAMRGVTNVHMLRKLVAKGLIKESGKSTMPGRPNLYVTTSEFLDYFGLSSIDELPDISNTSSDDKEEESELFTSIYKEDIEEPIKETNKRENDERKNQEKSINEENVRENLNDNMKRLENLNNNMKDLVDNNSENINESENNHEETEIPSLNSLENKESENNEFINIDNLKIFNNNSLNDLK